MTVRVSSKCNVRSSTILGDDCTARTLPDSSAKIVEAQGAAGFLLDEKLSQDINNHSIRLNVLWRQSVRVAVCQANFSLRRFFGEGLPLSVRAGVVKHGIRLCPF